MRKKYVLLVIIAVIALVYFQTNIDKTNIDEVSVRLNDQDYYVSKYASISKDEWESVDPTNTRYPTVEEFLTEIDYYVDEIAVILGREAWLNELLSQEGESRGRIEFKFSTDKTSRAFGGGAEYSFRFVKPIVELHRDTFESGWMVITHELTHIISSYPKSNTLSEGLACYMQDRVSLSNLSFKSDLKEITEDFLTYGYEYICDYLGNAENGKNKLHTSDTEEIYAYYALSSSFANYIITNYGLESFLDLYESECDDKSYNDIFGKEREVLIKEFKDTFSSINSN